MSRLAPLGGWLKKGEFAEAVFSAPNTATWSWSRLPAGASALKTPPPPGEAPTIPWSDAEVGLLWVISRYNSPRASRPPTSPIPAYQTTCTVWMWVRQALAPMRRFSRFAIPRSSRSVGRYSQTHLATRRRRCGGFGRPSIFDVLPPRCTGYANSVTVDLRSSLPQPTRGPIAAVKSALSTTQYMSCR